MSQRNIFDASWHIHHLYLQQHLILAVLFSFVLLFCIKSYKVLWLRVCMCVRVQGLEAERKNRCFLLHSFFLHWPFLHTYTQTQHRLPDWIKIFLFFFILLYIIALWVMAFSHCSGLTGILKAVHEPESKSCLVLLVFSAYIILNYFKMAQCGSCKSLNRDTDYFAVSHCVNCWISANR